MAAKKVLETAVVLSAVDRMSRVINSAFGKADRRITEFQKRADKVARASQRIGRTSAAIGTAIATPLFLAGREAIKFEESMADVAKVLDLQRGSKELSAMGKGARDLAVHLAKTPDKAAEMVAALAQGGTAKGELFTIGKFAGEMSVAFDIMAERAGSSFAKTKNALGATTSATMDVMNAINFLSDNTASKASQILTFMASGGASAARMMKITGQESAALGAFFISMGKSGSEAATIVSRLTKGLQKNNQAGKIFRSQGGGLAGLFEVLKRGNTLAGVERAKFFSQFGQYGQDIGLAASNMEQLSKTTGLVIDKTRFADSVAKEFANRSNTRAFELAKVQSQLSAVGIQIGNSLLPVVSQLVTAVAPLLTRTAKWIEKNPELTAQLVKGAAVTAAAMVAISGLSFAVAGIARTLSFASKGLQVFVRASGFLALILTRPTAMLRLLRLRALGLTKALRFVPVVIRAIAAAMIANPIGATIAAIAAGAFLVWKHWGTIKPFFVKLWADIKKIFEGAWNAVSNFSSRFLEAGKNLIKSLAKGMIATAGAPIKAMVKVGQKIRDHLPFSPAKIGPLRDLHRIRISETIAQSIRPSPVVAAMRRTVGSIANPNQPVGASALGSGGQSGAISINFQPSITIGFTGGANGSVKDQLIEGFANLFRGIVKVSRGSPAKKGTNFVFK